ncbi:MAG: hypothetical protein LBT59_00680 [Clostridiales bacterium]|nr:hypothetical protein [Clostridiales bacterium]
MDIKHYNTFRNGTPCESYSLKTAESAVALNIDIDRPNLSAGLPDLAYITITLEDKNGLQTLFESQEIKIFVEGCGKLLGFGSADPKFSILVVSVLVPPFIRGY